VPVRAVAPGVGRKWCIRETARWVVFLPLLRLCLKLADVVFAVVPQVGRNFTTSKATPISTTCDARTHRASEAPHKHENAFVVRVPFLSFAHNNMYWLYSSTYL
jgi:hypothetical protein